jgi:hypothetical protein
MLAARRELKPRAGNPAGETALGQQLSPSRMQKAPAVSDRTWPGKTKLRLVGEPRSPAISTAATGLTPTVAEAANFFRTFFRAAKLPSSRTCLKSLETTQTELASAASTSCFSAWSFQWTDAQSRNHVREPAATLAAGVLFVIILASPAKGGDTIFCKLSSGAIKVRAA